MDKPDTPAAEAPAIETPPHRVHEFIVHVADRGPSTRALAFTVVGALAASVLLLFAMPKPAPHEVRQTAPDTALVVPSSESSVTPPQVEPPIPVTTSRVEAPVTPAVSGYIPPAAAVADTAAPRARIEPAVAEAPRVEAPPRVVDVAHSETPPASADTRPAADLIVAPPIVARDTDSRPLPLATRDELTPRPPPRGLDRTAIGATDTSAPLRTVEPAGPND